MSEEENKNEKVSVEVPIEVTQREGDGVCSIGIHGTTDYSAIQDRKYRQERIKEMEDYRGTIPCDRCSRCLEMRGFNELGNQITLGLYCLYGEFETTAWHTCNRAKTANNNRRKIVYDMRNAPFGFSEGLSRVQLQTRDVAIPKYVDEDHAKPYGEYTGGSRYYKRADGDKTKVGSGKVPTSLAN